MATVRPRGADGRFVASAGPQHKKKSITLTRRQREQAGEGVLDKHWRTYFLQALAETSNVTQSAATAGIASSRAYNCLLYTSPSPRDLSTSRMPSSA